MLPRPLSSRISPVVLLSAALLTTWPSAGLADNAGQQWVLLIGINDYATMDKDDDLKYAVADVQAMRQKFIKLGVPERNIYLLCDGQPAKYLPTKGNIDRELPNALGQPGIDDTIFVVFCGHGVLIRNDEADTATNYLIPNDGSIGKPDTLLKVNDVFNELSRCQALRKVMLVDACRSTPRTQTRLPGELKAIPFSQPVPPEGCYLLSSCREKELAHEEDELRHGVFTHFVLEGLTGKADQARRSNKDGRVSLQELCNYVTYETQTYISRKYSALQVPTLRGGGTGDWDLTPSLKLMPEAGETISNTLGMKLAYIPAGEFLMGSPASRKHRCDDEMQHRVRLTKGFYLGTHEVTQAEFQRVLGFNPSGFQRGSEEAGKGSGLDTSRFPVEHVSWYDAVEFCNKLSELERLAPCYRLTGIEPREDNDRGIKNATVSVLSSGTGYRLPTEAEWEYACRAGTTTPFHFGSVLNGREANVNGSFPYGTTTKGPYSVGPTRVGMYAKNGWGLYDMHGNVFEWCQDWYDDDYYGGSPLVDPVGPAAGSFRVNRGGGWSYDARYCRSEYRYHDAPGIHSSSLGFRVAQVPAE